MGVRKPSYGPPYALEGLPAPVDLRAPLVDEGAEEPGYLTRQLITCLGNKRALLGPIEAALERVRRRLGGRRVAALDAFAGSGVVSRLLKPHAHRLLSNDLEPYAASLARCFLTNRSEGRLEELIEVVNDLNRRVEARRLPRGFIEEMYAPRDEARIRGEDRVFYTKDNARRLDDYRRYLGELPEAWFRLLIGPLLGRASVHANTAGVFKGFYKDRATGIGQFGGSGRDALSRIRGKVELEVPVLSRHECAIEVYEEDANALARRVRGLDLAYIDPPYNQHPYGSNYFMLNLLVSYARPTEVSAVSGIPRDWRRSGYNSRRTAQRLLAELLAQLDAPFLLVSANDEGFVASEDMAALLAGLGRVQVFETRYPAFRGSRSFERRPIHVTERLFLVERG